MVKRSKTRLLGARSDVKYPQFSDVAADDFYQICVIPKFVLKP